MMELGDDEYSQLLRQLDLEGGVPNIATLAQGVYDGESWSDDDDDLSSLDDDGLKEAVLNSCPLPLGDAKLVEFGTYYPGVIETIAEISRRVENAEVGIVEDHVIDFILDYYPTFLAVHEGWVYYDQHGLCKEKLPILAPKEGLIMACPEPYPNYWGYISVEGSDQVNLALVSQSVKLNTDEIVTVARDTGVAIPALKGLEHAVVVGDDGNPKYHAIVSCGDLVHVTHKRCSLGRNSPYMVGSYSIDPGLGWSLTGSVRHSLRRNKSMVRKRSGGIMIMGNRASGFVSFTDCGALLARNMCRRSGFLWLERHNESRRRKWYREQLYLLALVGTLLLIFLSLGFAFGYLLGRTGGMNGDMDNPEDLVDGTSGTSGTTGVQIASTGFVSEISEHDG